MSCACFSESATYVLILFCWKTMAVNQDVRSRSGQFWFNLNKCTVNTWLAGVLSNHRVTNASGWFSAKRQRGSSKTRHWGHGWTVWWEKSQLHTSENWEFPDGGCMLFINIFSPLGAVNHCFILLFIKWVLMYWHNPATSLALRDPVVYVHF